MRTQGVGLGVVATLALALAFGCDRTEPNAPAGAEVFALEATRASPII